MASIKRYEHICVDQTAEDTYIGTGDALSDWTFKLQYCKTLHPLRFPIFCIYTMKFNLCLYINLILKDICIHGKLKWPIIQSAIANKFFFKEISKHDFFQHYQGVT